MPYDGGMRILVTGAAGQVGSHVVEGLLARGDEVWGIDNFCTGRPEHLPLDSAFVFVEGTIADRETVNSLFADAQPDVVVHTAASYKDPDDWSEDVATNVQGMVNLVQVAQAAGTSRLIYFQTALIYGVRPDENPVPLGHPRRYENSSYAISKGSAEDYLRLSGLDHVVFRLANVIGDRCVSGPLPIFYERLKAGKKCFVTPARRDFVFVEDLVSVVLQAVDGVGHGAYHFSSGTDVAIRDLYDAVARGMQIDPIPEPDVRPLSADDAPSILLDPARTYQDFGQPEFTDLDGIALAAISYYEKFGVQGGFTHLKIEQS